MQDDVVRLREQSAMARRLATLNPDREVASNLIAYAKDCERAAKGLEDARQTAKDQFSRF